MATITKEERNAWLEERRTGLGGSDIAKILKLSKWGTQVDVWLDKKGMREPDPENEAMRLGTVLEPYVADRFTEETGRLCIDYKPTIHNGCMLGNLDRIVVEDGQDAMAMLAQLRAGDLSCVESILECKTSTKMDDWQDEYGNDVVPEYYRSQVMWYMGLIPTCKRCYVAVYFTGLTKAFKFMVVERDDGLISKVQKFAQDWWQTYIVENQMPPVETGEEALALFPKAVLNSTMKAEDGILAKIKDFREKVAKAKEIAAEADKIKSEIQTAMTDTKKRLSYEAILDAEDRVLVLWKNNKDSTKTDWESVAREAGATDELIKKHTSIKTGARVFAVKDPDKAKGRKKAA